MFYQYYEMQENLFERYGRDANRNEYDKYELGGSSSTSPEPTPPKAEENNYTSTKNNHASTENHNPPKESGISSEPPSHTPSDTPSAPQTADTVTLDDTLIGGAGDDILNGGRGSDTYVFGQGHGNDIINEESDDTQTDTDTVADRITFTDISDPNSLWFDRQQRHLVIRRLDGQDSVTGNNWFADPKYRIEHIQLTDGRTMDTAQAEQLIQAMAAFGSQYGGDITLAPQEDVKQYLDKLSVPSYWG